MYLPRARMYARLVRENQHRRYGRGFYRTSDVRVGLRMRYTTTAAIFFKGIAEETNSLALVTIIVKGARMKSRKVSTRSNTTLK